MTTPEEKQRALSRVLAVNQYDERSELWIYLIWLCLTVRKDGEPDFEAVEEETGHSARFLREGFRKLSKHGDAVRALAKWVIENDEHGYDQE